MLVNILVINYLYLVNILNVVSVIKKLIFRFDLILINLSLISYMWLMVIILDCLEIRYFKSKSYLVVDFKIFDKYFRNKGMVFLVDYMYGFML